eukprot:COSAG01_NODE_41238_length_454_cov_0.597183_1_plen_60_part_10
MNTTVVSDKCNPLLVGELLSTRSPKMPAAPPARPIQLSPNGTTLAGPTAQMLPSGLLAVP